MVTFGTNTVHTFGTAAPAAAAPAAPGTPGGGFAFGGAAAAAPAVAQPSTPTIGSTPAPPPATPGGGGFSFGGAGATPGAPAAPGLFGTPAPAPAAGGLFDAAAAAPAAGGGLFGAPAPAAAAGLFGAPAPAAPTAPTAAGSFFGSTAPAAPSPYAGYGQPQPQQPNPHAAAAAAAAQSAAISHQAAESTQLESAILRLTSLYSPTTLDPSHLIGHTPHHPTQPSSLCQFKYVYYDPMTSQQRHARAAHGPHHLPAKPPYVDNGTWTEACGRNPDPAELVPAVVVGSEALTARLTSQQLQATKLAAYVARLNDALTVLRSQSDQSTRIVESQTARHARLRSRLLELMRKVELVRCTNLPLQGGEVDALRRVREVKGCVDRVGGVLGEVEERGRVQVHALRSLAATSAAATAAAGGGGDGYHGSDGGTDLELSESARAELGGVLAEQRAGLDALTAIAARDVRDARIAREEVLAGGSGGGGGAATAAGVAGIGAGGVGGAPGGAAGGVGRHNVGGHGAAAGGAVGGVGGVVGRAPSAVIGGVPHLGTTGYYRGY